MSKILPIEDFLFYDEDIVNINYPSPKNIIEGNPSSPIPIKNSNLTYNLSKDSFDNLYYFSLKIRIKKNNFVNEKIFTCYNTKDYANLIKSSHRIEFDNLEKYEINVNYGETSFSLKGDINNNLSCYIDKNENLYVEFSQDSFGNTLCSCYFLNKNINNLCISPPN